MADFYSAQSQALFDDILWLPQRGAATGPTGRPPNSYAVLTPDASILIDAVYSWTMAGVARVADAGHPPTAFVLTHADVAEQGDAFDEIRSTYGCPILMHPADAATPRAAKAGVAFMDPTRDRALRDAELQVFELPYHTPGSIMLYTNRNRGVLFAGDSAVAPGPKQPADPPRLERPKVEPDQDEAFRRDWNALKAQHLINSVLPLHGTPYVNRADMYEIMRTLYGGEPMDPAAAEHEVETPSMVASGVA